MTKVKFTASFEANVESLESFCEEASFPEGYDRLLGELSDVVIPNLERFPAVGRSFASRSPDSIEAVVRQEKLSAMLSRLGEDGDIREYVMEDHIILYALINDVVYLLAIRHHRQLSFDVAGLWLDGPT